MSIRVKFRYERAEWQDYVRHWEEVHGKSPDHDQLCFAIEIAILVCFSVGVGLATMTLLGISFLALYGIGFFAVWLQRRRSIQQERELSINAVGIGTTNNSSRWRIAWQAYSHVVETELLVAFHRRNSTIETIPKRVLTIGEIEQLREWSTKTDSVACERTNLREEFLDKSVPDFSFTYTHQDFLNSQSAKSSAVDFEQTSSDPASKTNKTNIALGIILLLLAFAFCYGLATNFLSTLIFLVAFFLCLATLHYVEKFFTTDSADNIAEQFPFELDVYFVESGLGIGSDTAFSLFDRRDFEEVTENEHCYRIRGAQLDYTFPKRLFEDESESKSFLRKLLASHSLQQVTSDTNAHTGVETGNPYQSPIEQSTNDACYLAPSLIRWGLGPAIGFFFLISLLFAGVGIALVFEAFFFGQQVESWYELMVYLIMPTIISSFTAFLAYKGLPLWRHRADEYFIDGEHLYINREQYALDELRLRSHRLTQTAFIMNGKTRLTAMDFSYPAYRRLKPLVMSE